MIPFWGIKPIKKNVISVDRKGTVFQVKLKLEQIDWMKILKKRILKKI